MIRGFVWLLVASLSMALVGLVATAPAPQAVQAQGAPRGEITCPAAQPRVPIDVCVDRGDGGLYFEGDPITICVTVTNLTAVPFTFTVRLTRYVNGVFQEVLLKESMDSGQRCIKGVIGPPFGSVEIRADLLRPDGSVYDSDSVFYRSAPRPGPLHWRPMTRVAPSEGR